MTIRDWPADERPREKLLTRGAATLSDAELVAIFLGSGGRGEDAVARGRALLLRHGSLRGLLSLPVKSLRALPGIGPASACRLLAALELGHRHLGEALARGAVVSDPASAGALFRSRLRDRPHEVFACVFLDTRHRMIAFEELFNGGIDGAEVHPREVVRRCLSHNAAAVVFAGTTTRAASPNRAPPTAPSPSGCARRWR
jgi:DNA repair protein RadC